MILTLKSWQCSQICLGGRKKKLVPCIYNHPLLLSRQTTDLWFPTMAPFSFWCLKKHNMSVFPFPRCVVVIQEIISWEIISKQYLNELYWLLFFHWEIYNVHSNILVLCYIWVCHKCEVTIEMEQRSFLKRREEFGTAWQFILPQLIPGVSNVSAINVLVELAAAP